MAQENRDLALRLGLRRADGEAYYRRALKNHETGHLDEAIADVSEAIFYDRGYAEYYAVRGVFFIENGQPNEAEVDLAYALRLNRRHWLAHYGMGILRFRAGDLETALVAFDSAIRFGARKPEAWAYRAVVHHLLSNDDQAVQDIDRAIAAMPQTDKRIKDLRAWKRQIEGGLPEVEKQDSKPIKKPRARKTANTDRLPPEGTGTGPASPRLPPGGP